MPASSQDADHSQVQAQRTANSEAPLAVESPPTPIYRGVGGGAPGGGRPGHDEDVGDANPKRPR
ncbi:MAG: hypothetical protein JNL18_16880 [Planctomycetaceae bacterium]|nr:hypothetical protein [Planctomycetaceae bacterium]